MPWWRRAAPTPDPGPDPVSPELRAWAEALGDIHPGSTRVAGLRRGVLDVEVSNGVLLQELAHFHKRRLLAALRSRLPEVTLTDLRFRVGTWKTKD